MAAKPPVKTLWVLTQLGTLPETLLKGVDKLSPHPVTSNLYPLLGGSYQTKVKRSRRKNQMALVDWIEFPSLRVGPSATPAVSLRGKGQISLSGKTTAHVTEYAGNGRRFLLDRDETNPRKFTFIPLKDGGKLPQGATESMVRTSQYSEKTKNMGFSAATLLRHLGINLDTLTSHRIDATLEKNGRVSFVIPEGKDIPLKEKMERTATKPTTPNPTEESEEDGEEEDEE